MKFVLYSETNKDKSTEIFPPLLLKPTVCALRMCNVKGQKRSAKGSNFKEDDRDLPLLELLLYAL